MRCIQRSTEEPGKDLKGNRSGLLVFYAMYYFKKRINVSERDYSPRVSSAAIALKRARARAQVLLVSIQMRAPAGSTTSDKRRVEFHL